MSVDPKPNKKRIELITAALNANTVHELVTSHGLSLIKDCICFLNDLHKNYDKALFIDFCIRHGGLTKENIKRLLPGVIGGKRTNHCGKCHRLGHQQTYCVF